MTRYMYDACNPANLPTGELGAVYVDGRCRVTNTQGRRTISSIAVAYADEGDVEPGNPYWPAWVSWVQRQREAGNQYPWLYCCDDNYGGSFWNGWRHADGVEFFRSAGVPQPLWRVFRMGATVIPGYAIGVQTAVDVPPGYDISILLDYIPGMDTPSPPPVPPEVTNMADWTSMDFDAVNQQEHYVNLQDQGSGNGAIWYNGYDRASGKWLGPVNIIPNGIRLDGGITCMVMGNALSVTAIPAAGTAQQSSLHWFCPLPMVPGQVKFTESNFP